MSQSGSKQKKALHVLHIGKYFPPHHGGMETFLRDLMAEQQRQGLKVSAIVHSTQRSLRSAHDRQTEHGEVLSVIRVARWFTLAFAPVSPSFPLLLRRVIVEQQPDILHIHMPNVSAFWCLFLPQARRIRWVIHWHADVLASTHSAALRWLYRFYRPFEQALLRRAALIIGTSPPYVASSEPLRLHRDRCRVVPLGISDRATVAPEIERGEGELRAVFLGRLTYYKGLQHLIHAVAGLERVDLRIIGEGEERAALSELVASLGASQQIHFLGSLEDHAVASELTNCDCLCLSSIERTEAFGVVLLEAMRAGRATLATKVRGSGMSWVVNDGETGLLVAPECDESIRSGLVKLRDDPCARIGMGSAARERFLAKFTIENISAELEACYRSCL